MKTWFCSVALFGALVLGTVVAPCARAEKYALLVGMTEMTNNPRGNWLSGPVNDLPMMREVLQGFYGFKNENVRSLIGRESTRAGIERAFREQLIGKAKPGDYVLFYYSPNFPTKTATRPTARTRNCVRWIAAAPSKATFPTTLWLIGSGNSRPKMRF